MSFQDNAHDAAGDVADRDATLAATALGHAIAALRPHLPVYRAALRAPDPASFFGRILGPGAYSSARREAVDEAMRATVSGALALVATYDRNIATVHLILQGGSTQEDQP